MERVINAFGAKIIIFGAVLGLLLGFSAGYIQYAEFEDEKNYCKSVEEAMLDNITEDEVISCFTPKDVSSSIDPTVDELTDVECVCRRRIGGNVHNIVLSRAR